MDEPDYDYAPDPDEDWLDWRDELAEASLFDQEEDAAAPRMKSGTHS